MSAFLLSPTHVDLMVRAGADHRRRHTSDVGLRWYWNGKSYRLGPCDDRECARVFAMLEAENRLSLRQRYEGRADEAETPLKRPPAKVAYLRRLTAAELFHLVNCYEYQTCEHPGWPTSEAFAYCRALKRAAEDLVEGDAGPWGWEAEDAEKRLGTGLRVVFGM